MSAEDFLALADTFPALDRFDIAHKLLELYGKGFQDGIRKMAEFRIDES